MFLTRKIPLNTWMFCFVVTASVLFLILDKTGSYMYNLEFEYLIFALLILISILLNHYFKNVFLEVLIIFTILFFLIRLLVLTNGNLSNQFVLQNLSHEDVQNSLSLLSFIYFSLASSIIIINPKLDRKSLIIDTRHQKLIHAIILFVLLVIVINFYVAIVTGSDSTVLGTSSIFFKILANDNALFLLFTTIVLTPQNMLKKYWPIIFAIFVLFTITALYGGTKSGIFLIILAFLMSTWALNGPMRISVLQIMGVFFVLPMALFVFLVGGYTRYFYYGDDTLLGSLSKIPLGETIWIENLLSSFSYRIGYFDDFVNFTNSEMYWSNVSIQKYLQAIIDKLSPGFDLFNTAYVSRYFHDAKIIGVVQEDSIMNSTQMGGFAENYMLFGYWVIIPFMMMMFLFRFLAGLCKSFSPISRGLFLTLVVHFFWKWIEGFGYDMLVINEGIYRLIFFFLVVIFVTREVKISSAN